MVSVTVSFKADPADLTRLNLAADALRALVQKDVDAAQKKGDREKAEEALLLLRRLTINNVMRACLALTLRDHSKLATLLKLIETEGTKIGRPARGS